MEFQEFVRERRRMCKETFCSECPISKFRIDCSYACLTNPEEAEKIVSDWSKEHPIVTNEQKLKEVLQDTFGEDYKNYMLISCFSEWADKEYKKPREG